MLTTNCKATWSVVQSHIGHILYQNDRYPSLWSVSWMDCPCQSQHEHCNHLQHDTAATERLQYTWGNFKQIKLYNNSLTLEIKGYQIANHSGEYNMCKGWLWTVTVNHQNMNSETATSPNLWDRIKGGFGHFTLLTTWTANWLVANTPNVNPC